MSTPLDLSFQVQLSPHLQQNSSSGFTVPRWRWAGWGTLSENRDPHASCTSDQSLIVECGEKVCDQGSEDSAQHNCVSLSLERDRLPVFIFFWKQAGLFSKTTNVLTQFHRNTLFCMLSTKHHNDFRLNSKTEKGRSFYKRDNRRSKRERNFVPSSKGNCTKIQEKLLTRQQYLPTPPRIKIPVFRFPDRNFLRPERKGPHCARIERKLLQHRERWSSTEIREGKEPHSKRSQHPPDMRILLLSLSSVSSRARLRPATTTLEDARVTSVLHWTEAAKLRGAVSWDSVSIAESPAGPAGGKRPPFSPCNRTHGSTFWGTVMSWGDGVVTACNPGPAWYTPFAPPISFSCRWVAACRYLAHSSYPHIVATSEAKHPLLFRMLKRNASKLRGKKWRRHCFKRSGFFFAIQLPFECRIGLQDSNLQVKSRDMLENIQPRNGKCSLWEAFAVFYSPSWKMTRFTWVRKWTAARNKSDFSSEENRAQFPVLTRVWLRVRSTSWRIPCCLCAPLCARRSLPGNPEMNRCAEWSVQHWQKWIFLEAQRVTSFFLEQNMFSVEAFVPTALWRALLTETSFRKTSALSNNFFVSSCRSEELILAKKGSTFTDWWKQTTKPCPNKINFIYIPTLVFLNHFCIWRRHVLMSKCLLATKSITSEVRKVSYLGAETSNTAT